ncbi:MAG: helix-turn-helix domain-containing protein [Halobacteriales archaeon]|nr:helix-turn-helix domain-containing protein [Halobacteriales archaeon]
MTEKEGDDTTETEETTEEPGTEDETDVFDEAEEKVEETAEEVEEAVEETEETVKEGVEEVEERAEDIEERVEGRAENVLDSVDDNVDRLLSEILDTRSRVAVYVGLRQKERATADEVAEETGLYPDKVERVIEELEDDDVVEKTADGKAYKAVSPTELVRRVPESVGGWLSDLIGSGDDEEKETAKTTEIDVE